MRDEARRRRTVPGLEGATGLVMGETATCARMTSGPMRCLGQLDEVGTFREPGALQLLPDAAELHTSTLFGCARRTTGTIACWGANLVGQLGNGAAPDPKLRVPIKVDNASGEVTAPPIAGGHSASLVDVTGVDDAVQLAVGGGHACALRRTGTVVCWGKDMDGQLGDRRAGNGVSSDHPVEVAGLGDVTAIAAGTNATCAVSKGSVWCWGSLAEFHASPKPMWAEPAQIAGIDGAVEVTVAETEACARSGTGTVQCWTATTKPFGRDHGKAVQLVSGFRHHCARMESGAVRCWGDNLNGQLGTNEGGDVPGSITSSSSPPVARTRAYDAVCDPHLDPTHLQPHSAEVL